MAITGHVANPNYRSSINTHDGDGVQTNWDISFDGGFLDRSHVKSYITDISGVTTVPTLQWVSDTVVRVVPPAPAGSILTIYRDTPRDKPLADFSDGAIISELNLDRNAKQAVFIAAEAIDRGEGALSEFAPRAIMVPIGEIAPYFPPRDLVRGRILAVNLQGNIEGLSYTDLGLVNSTDMILHEGLPLNTLLTSTIAQVALSGTDIVNNTNSITTNGLNIIAQATTTAAIDTRLTQLGTDFTSLVGVVNALTQVDTSGFATLISDESSARITADTAMAAHIALIGAASPDGLTFVLNLDTTKVSPTETLSNRFAAITASVGANTALITTEQQARIDGDSAEATARQSLGTTLNGNISAAIATEQLARSTADAAEATARTTLASTLRGETSSAVAGEATNRAAAITAAISSEALVRSTADAAEATARTSLAADLRSETSAYITTEQNARATADAAEATARTQLGAALTTDYTAQVQNEATIRASANLQFANTIALLGATNAGGTAFILDSNTVMTSPSQTLAQRLSGIDTHMGNTDTSVTNLTTTVSNGFAAAASDRSAITATLRGETSAAITTEQNARVAADGAISTSVNTLSTTVGGHTATIAAQQTSINGLVLKYSIRLDSNGYVSGFEQNNNGVTSDFVIRADKFVFALPGYTSRQPFSVNANGVTIEGDLYVNGGRIVVDTGAYMKVQGKGFGTTNQFVEWYGPTMGISSCSESNATYYLKVDGSAYFGGALSAGVINNSAQTTDTSQVATIVLGPFATNGGQKNVVLSYTWATSGFTTAGTGGTSTGTATIILERSINGGAWATVATLNVSGAASWTAADMYGYGQFTGTMTGATSFVDNDTTVTSNFQYRGRITARSPPGVPSVSSTTSTTQTVSVVSTEA